MKSSGGRRGAPRQGRAASSRSANGKKGGAAQPQRPAAKKKQAPKPAPVVEEPREFRLGIVPGATPAKWIGVWRERMPHVSLELVHLAAHDANAALLNDEADIVIMRPPVDERDLRHFTLYEEIPVVVVGKESALTAADELSAADLAGEVVIVAGDDVLRLDPIPGTEAAKFSVNTAEDAIATIATGVGITIIPMSIARALHRKDVEYRPYLDAEPTPVVLAWHADRETPDVQTFIGIARGRTANSSRG